MRWLSIFFGCVLACACTGHDEVVSASRSARTPWALPAASDGTLSFTNGLDYAVTLTRARLHVGAIYLNQSVPSSGSQETSCVLPDIYVAQVIGPLEVNALLERLATLPPSRRRHRARSQGGRVVADGRRRQHH